MAMPPAPTASFGKIDEFDPTTDSWDIYCERLHHCFTARNIDENATELKEQIEDKTTSLLVQIDNRIRILVML